MAQNLSIFLLWLLLMVLTAITAVFAESYAATIGLVALVLSVTVVKAKVLVDSFMGLSNAPLMWRCLLLAYAPVIGIIVTLTYLF
ncbi:cytochrome C oxidase subunit IV family protein [Amphritea sp. HPY]|uniref:cytochrome C oxidase subunit IV family protein n=1 Tax=Amphritea sp. HPY TaxID=3421652 RepID=UPI003D7ED984